MDGKRCNSNAWLSEEKRIFKLKIHVFLESNILLLVRKEWWEVIVLFVKKVLTYKTPVFFSTRTIFIIIIIIIITIIIITIIIITIIIITIIIIIIINFFFFSYFVKDDRTEVLANKIKRPYPRAKSLSQTQKVGKAIDIKCPRNAWGSLPLRINIDICITWRPKQALWQKPQDKI